MGRPSNGYRLSNGQRIPGVTTICGRFKETGGLLQWAFKQGQDGKANLYDERDEAGGIGTYTHELIEWHLNGESGKEPEADAELTNSAIARGRMAYEQFLRWEQVTGYHIISWEQPMISEKYKYGGTIDTVFEFKGEMILGDWKSARSIYPETLLQTAAYIILWDENFPENPITGGIDIVRFSKDSEVSDHKSVRDKKLIEVAKRQFLLYREAYELDKTIKNLF